MIKPSQKSDWQVRFSPRIIIGVLFVLAGGYASYRYFMPDGMQEAEKSGMAIPVEVATVQEKPLDVILETVGTLKADESVVIRPELAGRIEEIHFEEGTQVKKGTALVTLDDAIYRAELQQAEAALTLARQTHQRAKQLRESGAATERTLDEATAALRVAEATVALARAKLNKTVLRAPFDGVVGLRHVSPGDFVNAGQDIVNFQADDPMKVEFSIPETSARFLQAGQQIVLSVDALPGEPFTGTVYALDAAASVEDRSLMLRATVPNPEHRLKAGFFAHVRLQVEHKERAKMIPEEAIIPQGSRHYVFAVGQDDIVQRVEVQIGARQEGEVEVLQGLQTGNRVVTAGHLKLQDGAKVVVSQAAGAEAPAADSVSDEDR